MSAPPATHPHAKVARLTVTIGNIHDHLHNPLTWFSCWIAYQVFTTAPAREMVPRPNTERRCAENLCDFPHIHRFLHRGGFVHLVDCGAQHEIREQPHEDKFREPPKDVHKPHCNLKKMRSRRTNKTSSTISLMSATRRSRKRNDTKKVSKRTEARALRGTTPVIHLDDAIIVIVLTSIQSRSNMRKLCGSPSCLHRSTLSKTRPWEVTLDDCEMLHHIPPLRRTLKDLQDANILELCVELFISISESVFTHLR